MSEEDYAKGMKEAGTLRKFSCNVEGGRGKFLWDPKKKKYLVIQGEEAYKKHYRRGGIVRTVMAELAILMLILDHWY